VQTQSFQIWLAKTAKELGWPVDVNESESPAKRQFELMAAYTQLHVCDHVAPRLAAGDQLFADGGQQS